MLKLDKERKMKKLISKYLSIAIIAIFSILFIAGCSEDNSVDPGTTNATVKGRVTNDDGYGKLGKISSSVEGATVVLARINSDGSLETVSNKSVQTNADGEFTIETEIDGESNLVVVATKNSDEWKSVISSEVRSGITVYVQTLNDETTEEAEVYQEAKQQNYNKVKYYQIANYVDAEVAGQIKANGNAQQVAAQLNTSMDAYAQAFTELGVTAEQWNEIVRAHEEAQATLERDLYYAETNAAVETAFENYQEAVVNAYYDAGVSATTLEKSMEISTRILINGSADLNSDLAFYLQRNAQAYNAIVVNQAVQNQFTALGTNSIQMSAVISAGAGLESAVKSANSYSEIMNAFDNYHSEIISELEIALGTYGSLVTVLNSSVIGFKANLQTKVGVNASTEQVINAYLDFYNQVRTYIEGELDAASQKQVNAAVNLMILLNVHF